jgi:hypothetical protein
MPVHVVLERLASIDENYGDLIVVPLQQLRIGIDVHFAPLEVGVALELGKSLLHDVTKMTFLARIHHNSVHKTIVSGRLGMLCLGRRSRMAWNLHIGVIWTAMQT